MQFKSVTLEMGRPTPWKQITHVRLVPGRRPDKAHARDRWQKLCGLADADGLIPIEKVLSALDPVRNLPSGREAAIRQDLRNWSNPVDHGNNSQDKGWIDLGRLQQSTAG